MQFFADRGFSLGRQLPSWEVLRAGFEGMFCGEKLEFFDTNSILTGPLDNGCHAVARSITSSRVAFRIGLVTCSSHPASRLLMNDSEFAAAESATIGVGAR